MDKAKISLSRKEAELVINADWILTKNSILKKAKNLLEHLQLQQQAFLANRPGILPEEILAVPPKISKGENYKGLPYLVLDYPRHFGKDDHFAVRCMFWWGNFFSITLHLAGTYKMNYQKKIGNAFSLLRDESFSIGVGSDQWEHHFETSNYLPVKEMSEAEFKTELGGKDFIKLAKKFSLEQWESAGENLFITFQKLIGWMSN